MRVVKWGDGLAVHLPAEIVEALGLKEGDDIDIRIASHRRSNVDHEND
jgi:antitoxin MazE